MNAFTSAYGSDIFNKSVQAKKVYGPGLQLGLEFYLDRMRTFNLTKTGLVFCRKSHSLSQSIGKTIFIVKSLFNNVVETGTLKITI